MPRGLRRLSLRESETGLQQRFDDKPEDGHQQGGQQVERLAILQAKQGKTRCGDEQTADNEQFGHKVVADGLTGQACHEIEHALPAEQAGASQGLGWRQSGVSLAPDGSPSRAGRGSVRNEKREAYLSYAESRVRKTDRSSEKGETKREKRVSNRLRVLQ